ncbi:hypothetical protein PQX77_010439 [Marasmius sp. AFHP31]|nr:hypothetical protein PQX77_010439 [Marasmius sp. AFHP31]
MGADRTEIFPAVPVQEANRLRETGEVRDIEGWTAFDFPGRGVENSQLRWTEEHFSGIDFDRRTRKREIYRIVGGKHCGWSPRVDCELGNYDYLLGSDINHQHPTVREDFFRWGSWAIEVKPYVHSYTLSLLN